MINYKNGTNTTQAFGYDALGRRATENSGTSVDLYYSAAWQVLEEHRSGIAASQNVWSPFYVDDLVERDDDSGSAALDGDLDSTFGSSGKTTTDFGGTDTARALVIQRDGKTVLAGSSGNDFAIARYNLNGGLDTTFSGDGKLTVNVGGTDNAYATTIDSIGRILVAGRSDDDMALIRLSASSGALDDIGDDSSILVPFGTTGDTAVAYAIGMQSANNLIGGNIILGGYEHVASDGHYEFAVARLNGLDGSVDTTFGTSGKDMSTNTHN
jgi:uncharacterized delta-60 repeat protein